MTATTTTAAMICPIVKALMPEDFDAELLDVPGSLPEPEGVESSSTHLLVLML